MLDWIIREWREGHLGVLIVGGQVMVAGGLREETKAMDACLAAKQCPRMLAWIAEKETEGHVVELRTGSAPLHPDWLGRGWTCHVNVDDERLDFFGVPLRSPRRIAERFLGDPPDVTLASMVDLGYLKRSERPKDWAGIELIASRLRAEGDGNAMLFQERPPVAIRWPPGCARSGWRRYAVRRNADERVHRQVRRAWTRLRIYRRLRALHRLQIAAQCARTSGRGLSRAKKSP